MKSSLRLINFGFVPRSADLAILFLRVVLGLSILLLHGWGKLIHLNNGTEFPDPLGIGKYPTLILTVFAEIFCGALLIGGILTRFAAAVLLLTMGVAFFQVHQGDFFQPGAELAALYGIPDQRARILPFYAIRLLDLLRNYAGSAWALVTDRSRLAGTSARNERLAIWLSNS